MAPTKRLSNLTVRDARIIFKNFSGAEQQFNAKGDRNFNLVVDPESAEAMREDGWNIKYLKAREEGELPQPILKVKVSYKGRPPRVVMITSRGRTNLDEESIAVLDYADIEKIDLILNPYSWVVSGNAGITAYLHAIYVTIREDELERQYADIPEIGPGGQQLAIEANNPWGDGLEDLGENFEENRAIESGRF